MTGYSIRRLRISAVLITWGNYNRGVIYDEVKNTAAQAALGALWLPFILHVYYHYTCGFGSRKDIHF